MWYSNAYKMFDDYDERSKDTNMQSSKDEDPAEELFKSTPNAFKENSIITDRSPKISKKRLSISDDDNITIKEGKAYNNNKKIDTHKNAIEYLEKYRKVKWGRICKRQNGRSFILKDSNYEEECSVFFNKNKQQICLSNSTIQNTYSNHEPTIHKVSRNAGKLLGVTSKNYVYSEESSEKLTAVLQHNRYVSSENVNFPNIELELTKNRNGLDDSYVHPKSPLKFNKGLSGMFLKFLGVSRRKNKNHTDLIQRKRSEVCNTVTKVSDDKHKIPLIQTSNCRVMLEKIDVKVNFLSYFGLKPVVKTDVARLNELFLLHKYNTKNCCVRIKRVSLPR